MTQNRLLLGESTAGLSTDELINLIMLRVRNRQDDVATSCPHPVSDALMPKLSEPKVCPTCFIEQHTKTIKDVQRRLVERGGVFISKEEQGHKALRKELRDAKISLTNAVMQFETVLAEAQLPPEDLAHIRHALVEWEDKKIRLARIPGLVYVSGAEEDEPTKEDHEIARLMIEMLTMTLKKEVTPEEMEDKATTASTEAGPDQLTESLSPKPHQQPAVQTSHPVVLKTSEPCSAPIIENLQNKATLKSILKRKVAFSPADSPTISPVRKRVRTRNFAVVSPDVLNTSNPSPFDQLSVHRTIQPHHPHACAEQHRLRSDFHRGSANYTPGVWASSAFTEKVNTSFFKISWDEAEEQMRKEQEEATEDKKIVGGLKIVAGAFLGIWWTTNVMRHIDLEKIREAMAGSEAGPVT